MVEAIRINWRGKIGRWVDWGGPGWGQGSQLVLSTGEACRGESQESLVCHLARAEGGQWGNRARRAGTGRGGLEIIPGGVRPPSPPRYDTTVPEEPFCARGSIRLYLFLYYELLTRTCLSGSSLISLSLLSFRVGSSLFTIPFVKPILLCGGGVGDGGDGGAAVQRRRRRLEDSSGGGGLRMATSG